MVDATPPRVDVGLTEIQTRLAETTGRWLVDQDGKVRVRLMDLAEVVQEIGIDIAVGLVDREVAHRYQELAAAMRRSAPADRLVGVAEALNRWAAGLERRATELLATNRRASGGEQR